MTLDGMTITRAPDGSTTLISPLVAKYADMKPVMPKPLEKFHGNDKRMIARRVKVLADLEAARRG